MGIVALVAAAGMALPSPVLAEEGQGPRINFSVAATKDGASVPLPDIYVESFTLTNQPIVLDESGEGAESKGNIVGFRYRKTGSDGKGMFETLAPEGGAVGTTPIDIDGDGKTDTFQINGSPQAYTAADNKSLTVNINGVPITEDPLYCMREGDYRFTRLKNDTRNVREGDCELQSGINFLCGTSPFYARPVMRKDMQGTWVFKGVSHNNGQQKELAPCTGPYTQDFGESNNYGACVMDDPLGRGFKVVRWGHGNSIANLTFFVEFQSTTPSPTKVTQKKEAELDEAEWGNFFCTESSECAAAGAATASGSATTASCTGSPVAGRKRSRVSGIISSLDRLRNSVPSSEGIYLVECVAGADKDPLKRSSYACSSGNAGVDAQLGLNGGGFAAVAYGADGKPLTNLNLRAEANRGLDSIEWDSPRIANTNSTFMLAFKPGVTAQADAGSVGGQQFATLTSATGCSILMDPYGTVFDAGTGAPVTGAEVLLTRRTPEGTQVPVTAEDVYGKGTARSFANPVTTDAQGRYSFMVPDGSYKLFVHKDGYRFVDTAERTLKASSVYGPVYDGEWIVQKGEPVRRDVPLFPRDRASGR
jgi:hypothetical protein